MITTKCFMVKLKYSGEFRYYDLTPIHSEKLCVSPTDGPSEWSSTDDALLSIYNNNGGKDMWGDAWEFLFEITQ